MKYIFLSIVLLFYMVYSNSQTRADLEKQRVQMLKEINETEDILVEIRNDKSQSLEMLSLIDSKISTRNKLINNISKDATKVDSKISELEAQIKLLNSDVASIKKEYARVILLSYLNRQKLNQLMYILSATDVNQAYRRMKYLKQYSDFRKRQINSIKNIQVDLGKKLVELDVQKREKLGLVRKLEKENKSLSGEVSEKTKVINSLKRRESELTSVIRKNNRIADKLKDEIEKIIRKEIEQNRARAAAALAAKSSKNTKTKSVAPVNFDLAPDEALLSASFKENRGKLPWPTERGVITDFFGERSHPVYKSVKIRNYGLDISTVAGSNVRAIFDGEVRYVIPILGANYSVLVRHGNFYTVYKNLVDIKVKTGDKVKTKDVLGKVFTNTKSNSTILHIEVWDNLTRLDPQLWLMKN